MRARLVAVTAVTLGVALLPGVALAAPVDGYSPEITGAVDSPGNFSDTQIARTIDPAGDQVDVSVAGAAATIAIPSGAFSAPVDIVVTAPAEGLPGVTAGLDEAGFDGYEAVAALGVKFKNADGSDIVGKFGKPVSITLSGTGLGEEGQKAILFNSATSATVLPSTVGTNSVTFTIDADPNIAIIDPLAGTGTGMVADATASSTGLPFAGEYLAAGLAGAAGLGMLVVVSRRRSATR